LKSQANARKSGAKETAEAEDRAVKDERINPAVATLEKSATRKRPRIYKSSIPEILPPEFLESDSEDEDDADSSRLQRGPKKIKFDTAERILIQQERPPQDKRVGSTVYRVLGGQGNSQMAPKASQRSRNSKAFLLQRDKTPKHSGSFFAKR